VTTLVAGEDEMRGAIDVKLILIWKEKRVILAHLKFEKIEGVKKVLTLRPISLDIKLFTELMSSVWIILPIVSNDPS
jgi:hypothetical protein